MNWIAAVDIGGTSTKLGLINNAGEVFAFRRFETRPPAVQFLESLRSHLRELVAFQPDTAGIGVSVAGFIDAAHSRMTYNPNIPWLENVPLLDELSEAFHVPVRVEVDSNAATLGEHLFGQGAGNNRFLFLTIGTGIGVGMIVGGQLLRPTHECLGDAGHIIVEPGGRLCSCGGIGCAEAVASAPAILRQSGASALSNVPDAFFIEAGHHLGTLIASLAAIFFPDRIALGGGVCQASTLYIKAAISGFERSAALAVREAATVVAARLGAEASLIGAACPLLEVP